ncbi:uncharacterized protein EDB91DRAFT_1346926 [Suillus paluster]|uniref:uncharacterized protein n=1 Tax=Suillus paluster TaxID=48578 RepID=UPI001B871DDF|nr:uncharacterized protein EDB91DRAFT_1346926 [Suillus paluster]KAG1740815.1 hypothetical protein EDB91DRAFT_1346926 [Suillus paluster]
MEPHLKDQLVDLRLRLKALPTDIPILKTSKYNYSNLEPDRFGNRVDGLKLVERGPETEAVPVDKWVADTLEAAQGLILAAGKASSPEVELSTHDHLDIELVSGGSQTPHSPPINKPKATKKKKAKIVESDTSVVHLYRDAKLIPAKGKGGAKLDPLMDLVSVNPYLKSNPQKMIVRCAGRI